MRSIHSVAEADYQQIRLLATALGVSDGQAIGFLLRRLRELAGEAGEAEVTAPPTGISIYAVYDGVRTEATYDPATGSVTVTTGPLADQRFRSPRGAAIAVVRRENPRVHPNRNGWTFWIVTATGHTLQSVRQRIHS